MITCSQCGGANDIGRVFCTTCGTKLELTALTNATIPITAKRGSAGRIFGVLIGLILLLVILVAGLCLVPNSSSLGKEGSSSSGQNIVSPLRGLQGVKAGQSIGRLFREKDINGYLKRAVVKRIRVEDLSVDVKEGTLVVQMTKRIASFKLKSVRISPTFTYQVSYKDEDGTLTAKSARIGLMPLFGPLKRFAVKPIEKPVMAQHEWKAFQYVKQVRAENDAIWIRVAR
jgi:hypothetical protein